MPRSWLFASVLLYPFFLNTFFSFFHDMKKTFSHSQPLVSEMLSSTAIVRAVCCIFLLLSVPLSLSATDFSESADSIACTDCAATGGTSGVCFSAACRPTPEVSSSTTFRPQQLIFPSAAIAVGCAGIRSHLIDTRGTRQKHTFDNTLQYLPTAAYVGLGFIPGVKHEHKIGSRMMAGVTAFAIMTALCQGTKRLVREPRPDTGAKTSFPSGHTATAFMGAELCRLEYGWGYGAAAYAVAAGIGAMRIYNNRHWCNDVLAGAGVGVLSAQAAYWLLPLEERLFKRRSKPTSTRADMMLVPTYDSSVQAPGVAFALSF